MAFLDKLGEFAKTAADKANDSLEINRINSDIVMEQGNIQVYQTDLGKYYWAKFVMGEKLDDEAMHICDKIVAAQDRIRELETEIEAIKAQREAEKAERAEQKRLEAEQAAKEAAQRLEEVKGDTPVAVTVDGERFCGGCGAPLAEGQKFCGSCGKAVEHP
ncbi:zinc ribbon domain-containing protein [Anaerotignum lactatifermentans]|uniref:Zinc ribbon domain-containing protein n=1 Tax=Anaerotignum lactatifermentans TaxID=160404 RepID=A0ABS2GAU3_9FIRM|nr:zinc ribbon domain-containing protein [Anaerotignum lactatifermentans]MBM6829503.1 zinc ribbon domain-containing protein [Anaerotignum lactatifermentans]MBM6877997.1 zinc ribbon domain-containing protein [Anaerotignum lactatifermentans]MBM6951172.1 zinc ribbon domain-containing protein [Anaerotignum lactatifermentans]